VIGDGSGVGTIRNDDTVDTTLAALIDQVRDAMVSRENLLDDLADVRKDLNRRRTRDAIEDLQDFIAEVQDLSRRAQRVTASSGRRSIESETAAVWIEEAQSIIAALTNTLPQT